MISELVEYLKSLNYNVEIRGENEIRVYHDSLPMYLRIEIQGRFVYMSIKHGEELREVLEELRDSGENVEELVEDALSYLSIASLKVRTYIERQGYIPVFKLRNGSLEIHEILERLEEG